MLQRTFIVQASLMMIAIYDLYTFIVQDTGVSKAFCFLSQSQTLDLAEKACHGQNTLAYLWTWSLTE